MIFLFIFYMYKEANKDRLLYHEFQFSHFPQNFKPINLFFISDIHNRTINDSLLEQVKGKIDLVIIGGDLLDRRVPFKKVEENIKKLTKLGPAYFVWGNNDYEVDVEHFQSLLLKYKVNILNNDGVKIESEKGDYFYLLGVADVGTEMDRLDLALKNVEKEKFKVLVSHNPAIKDKINEDDQIQFVLCGHTHGGQIRIFGYGPYELGGVKQFGNTTMLVSNGYGTTFIPLRLGAKVETHFITLRHGD